MNAIELLKSDHQKVKGLFREFENSESDQEKEKLFQQIKSELEVHTHIEETIFYPVIKDEEELEDITLEGIEEHHVVDVLIRETENLTDDSSKFEPKVTVLIENVEHHIQEEEGEMFPKVQELFDEQTLEDLGAKMEAEKKKFSNSKPAAAGK